VIHDVILIKRLLSQSLMKVRRSVMNVVFPLVKVKKVKNVPEAIRVAHL